MRTIAKILLLFIVALGFGCVSKPADQAGTVAAPADFQVTVVAGGVAPWETQSRLELRTDGQCAFWQMSSADDAGKMGAEDINRFTLSFPELSTLYEAVVENKFFNLKERYDDETIADGSFASLTITAGGTTHTVRTRNTAVKNFDNIIRTLNDLVPESSRVIYFAIAQHPTMKDKKEGKRDPRGAP